MQRITEYLAKRTRVLFLMDAFGALITAFMLGIIWYNCCPWTGMPPGVLRKLALIALLLCSYSGVCALLLKKRRSSFIKGMAIANLLYCILTSVLLVIYYTELTILGIIYFVAELLVITLLVWLEYKVAVAIDKT
ncbi:MAG: hypothetical protein JNM21_14345 [Taibaiella sp.]|nr:hypothetical protein [Taibaiella sp.]